VAFLARRLGSGVLLVLALTLVTYLVFFTIPANPTCLAIDCGPGNATTPAQFAAARHQLGLDRPVLEQYGLFLWNLVRHGSFGESFTDRYSIRSALAHTLPQTASIVLGGALLLVLISLPLGAISALRAHGALDRGLLAFSLVGIALHPFVVGLLLKKVFAQTLGIAPFAGYCPLRGHGTVGAFGTEQACGGPLDWAYHLYLPWLVFALFFLPLYTRMFRARLLQTIGEPYVRTARAKGASEARVLGRHVFRNAVLPILPMLAMDVGTAVTTAIYVETIFGIGGLGAFAVSALSGNGGGYDLPAVVGIVFVVACAVVVLNFLADVAIAVLDPRITGRSGSALRFRRGELDRRRLAVAVAVAAAAVGGIATLVAFTGGGRSGGSVSAYTAGAKPLGVHWDDRLRAGDANLVVSVDRVVAGPHGWAVTARIENQFSPGDLTIRPGEGTAPAAAGFSLQFVTRTNLGGHEYVALPAVAFDPYPPSSLPVRASVRLTFAGPGQLPRGGTLIYVGFGLFSTAVSPPATVVSNSSFKLH
jgi:peptide/nickel transport system permease protein